MKTHRWRDLQKKKLSSKEIEAIDQVAEEELIELDLREVRQQLNVTQEDLAKAANISQPEVSRLERRRDHLTSTLRRIIEALGGKLEITAAIGNKRFRLPSS